MRLARLTGLERSKIEQEYLDKYPELADDIREMLPAMAEIEQAALQAFWWQSL